MSIERFSIDQFTRGWVIGKFEKSLFRDPSFEFAIKTMVASEIDVLHHHKIADEVTVIISGSVLVNGEVFSSGEIALIRAGESCQTEAITDTVMAVIKTPAASNDKYAG